MSGQLQDPAAFSPEKQPPMSILYETWLDCMEKIKMSFVPAEIETQVHDRPVLRIVAIYIYIYNY
jgi:hypothetical protein